MFLKGLIYQKVYEDIDKSIEWYEQASNRQSKNASYYLGNIYLNEEGYIDKKKALAYFKLTGDDNLEIIESLERELGEGDSAFASYVDNIIKSDISITEYPELVRKDFEDDFGRGWYYLSKFSQEALITGIVTFMTYKKIESKSKIKLDYSTVIMEISRALEYELKHVFFEKYIEYLKKENIQPMNYKRLDKFTYKNQNGELCFTEKTEWFTLGKLEYLILNNNSIASKCNLDKNIVQFCCDEAFNEKSFSNVFVEREKEVKEYLYQLSKQVRDINVLFRNVSAHSGNVATIDRASEYIDWIIKVKKLLVDFMKKVCGV